MRTTLATAVLVGSAAFDIQGSAPALRLRPADRRCAAPLASAPLATTAGPLAADIWSSSQVVRVEGDTLKTWDIGDPAIERVQLSIRSRGRPIESHVELWHTPAYIPAKFSVYTEDGIARPVHAVIETPKHPKTVAVYNKGTTDFPFEATVANTGLAKAYDAAFAGTQGSLVQGGQITSYTFGPEVESVQVLLKTVEKNMKAKIELTQGPNQIKQVVELYASSGYKNPFYLVIQTPGAINTLRVINQNTVEFPFDAYVAPYETGSEDDGKPVIGGL